MQTDDTPWEPPLAGSEVEHLIGALERLRATFRWKADGLDAAGLNTRIGSSTLTLGSLLKHLALVEDHASTVRLSGAPMGETWAPAADSWDWQFTSAADDESAHLYALWDGAVERSRARFTEALADGGPEQLVNMTWDDGRRASLRRVLFDLVEEYGRHTGHADLLREAVDGRTGEDPPPGWRPSAGEATAGPSSPAANVDANRAPGHAADRFSVTQLRLAIEVDDFDRAVAFYRDRLGLVEEFFVDSGDDARVVALQAGRATLELLTPAQRRLIDELEVGRDVSPPVRVAFEVTDVDTATTAAIAGGADQVAPPTETPWRSRNARIDGPGPIHLTLFEELD